MDFAVTRENFPSGPKHEVLAQVSGTGAVPEANEAAQSRYLFEVFCLTDPILLSVDTSKNVEKSLQ